MHAVTSLLILVLNVYLMSMLRLAKQISITATKVATNVLAEELVVEEHIALDQVPSSDREQVVLLLTLGGIIAM